MIVTSKTPDVHTLCTLMYFTNFQFILHRIPISFMRRSVPETKSVAPFLRCSIALSKNLFKNYAWRRSSRCAKAISTMVSELV